jgi:hypothetical protein
VVEVSYVVGDLVLIYHPPGDVVVGCKLRVPWVGPYRIVSKQSPVSYSMVSKVEGKRARAHVNRLRMLEPGTLVETSSPEDGLWPDSRRLLRGILQSRITAHGTRQYKVRHAGRAGFVWVDADRLPDVVKAAYELCSRQR